MPADKNNNQGQFSKLKRFFQVHYVRFPFIAYFSLFIFGIIFWGGFNWAMEMTNTESFCISCHEMETNVYREYRNTGHYSNRTGVRATCPDCHVPKEWNHMVVRKIAATNELLQKAIGTIDTREKFLDRRPELVRKVWQGMRESGSRECRNCHEFRYMDIAKQQLLAGQIHERAQEQSHTCIDCHMGIAHELPEELVAEEHLLFEARNLSCRDCHIDMAQSTGDEDWDWGD